MCPASMKDRSPFEPNARVAAKWGQKIKKKNAEMGYGLRRHLRGKKTGLAKGAVWKKGGATDEHGVAASSLLMTPESGVIKQKKIRDNVPRAFESKSQRS